MVSNTTTFIAWVFAFVLVCAFYVAEGKAGWEFREGFLALVDSSAEAVPEESAAPRDLRSEVTASGSDDDTRLTVNTVPPGARIRVMNIAPVYEPGMRLEPGAYDIEVTKPGYRTKRRVVELSPSRQTFTFHLQAE